MIIPDRYQVEDNYWAQWVQKYRLNENQYDRLAPNVHLKNFCERHHISYIDPTKNLRHQFSFGKHVYWPIDSHLNPLGHATIAKTISKHLQPDINT